MAEEIKQNLIVKRQLLRLPQRFATGPVMGRFLSELRDNRRIMANKCPKCGRHQLPAREVCADCRVEATLWEELGPEGVIAQYDLVYYASPDPLTGESRATPYTVVQISLDGCVGGDTFWHELNETDAARIKVGMRVRPVWNEKRLGAITDILYFEIVR